MGKMPVIFIGHGSPMNAIEDNVFTRNWKNIASKIEKPEAIISLSAHWYTMGSRIMDESNPRTIYDMYGFPEELYKIVYNAPGAPELAHKTRSRVTKKVITDNTWGFDHGTWSVLHVMYPDTDIPVFQISIDMTAGAEEHYETGRQISSLRNEGVLIMGSGNVVHNLSMINFEMEKGYSWAQDFDLFIKNKISEKDYKSVIDYKKTALIEGPYFTTPDHFSRCCMFSGLPAITTHLVQSGIASDPPSAKIMTHMIGS